MSIKKLKQLGDLSFQDKLTRAAELVEMTLGVIIFAYCLISTIGMILGANVKSLFHSTAYLQYQLSNVCLIIIGIELIMMITSHSVDSVVDVMLLAISRQMIVEHTAQMDNLLTVISVGLLFLIRKYLYLSKINKNDLLS